MNLLRVKAHKLIDLVPDAGLEDAIDSLVCLLEFYSSDYSLPLTQPKVEDRRIIQASDYTIKRMDILFGK